MADVRRFACAGARNSRDFFDRADGGGEADALRARAVGKGVEARERESEMRAALVVGDGVDFIDDDGAYVFRRASARFLGGQQDIERFRAS